MAKFLIAEKKLFKAKICMKCNAHNPPRADKCRKCGYKKLRAKSKESRGGK